ncbi:hypothetical protein FACS1894152_8530 [Bacilli bacterium]|nr:hypothetical protein FACS1894152_8530 [Bacilli bacterium]
MTLNPENAKNLMKTINMMMWGGIAGFILWLALRLYDFGSLAYKLVFNCTNNKYNYSVDK